jgi:hypothetical protein
VARTWRGPIESIRTDAVQMRGGRGWRETRRQKGAQRPKMALPVLEDAIGKAESSFIPHSRAGAADERGRVLVVADRRDRRAGASIAVDEATTSTHSAGPWAMMCRFARRNGDAGVMEDSESLPGSSGTCRCIWNRGSRGMRLHRRNRFVWSSALARLELTLREIVIPGPSPRPPTVQTPRPTRFSARQRRLTRVPFPPQRTDTISSTPRHGRTEGRHHGPESGSECWPRRRGRGGGNDASRLGGSRGATAELGPATGSARGPAPTKRQRLFSDARRMHSLPPPANRCALTGDSFDANGICQARANWSSAKRAFRIVAIRQPSKQKRLIVGAGRTPRIQQPNALTIDGGGLFHDPTIRHRVQRGAQGGRLLHRPRRAAACVSTVCKKPNAPSSRKTDIVLADIGGKCIYRYDVEGRPSD